MDPIKATLLDDDHFRLLAIPFTGPLPGGRDLDGQRFTPATNIYPKMLPARPIDWHHGLDSLMGRTILGKAVLDPEPEDDGWWVDVWLDHGKKRVELVKRLAEKAPIFGSSEALWVKATTDGEITEWPYWRQTLSTSPQNTHSVVRPAAKAMLDDLSTAGIAPDDRFRSFVTHLDDLQTNLGLTLRGDVLAKAGRVLSAANEAELQTAMDALGKVLAKLARAYETPA